MTEARLEWALCVATLNRVDMLARCVACALNQTRRPSEIVIVDASDDWQANHARIAAVVGGAVPLRYLPAPARSLTLQRNAAIETCRADICALIDDDSFMLPDCAENFMRVYEADTRGEILGIAGGDGPSPFTDMQDARKTGAVHSGQAAMMLKTRLRAFLWRELFLMGRAVTSIPYAGPFGSQVPGWAIEKGFNLVPAIQLPGCRMTARRSALLREPFEPAFRSYSPGEDFDLSYRLSRMGAICVAPDARIYHHEAATSRIRREQELVLSICNTAFLLRRHSPDLARDRRRWSVLMSRRLLAELLKDGLSRRWRFPQLRAARRAAATSRAILSFPDDARLSDWYVGVQERILARPGPGKRR